MYPINIRQMSHSRRLWSLTMKRRESSRLNPIHGTKSKIPKADKTTQRGQGSGRCGFSDEEIFSMAVHCIDEPTIEIGKPITCGVVVNRHIELNEEEKAEKKASPSNASQDEEPGKLQNCNSLIDKSLPALRRNPGRWSNRKRTSNPNSHFRPLPRKQSQDSIDRRVSLPMRG